jgi:iron complex transport system ATP-binding protein
MSAVVTMHDLNLATRFADKFIMMKGGCIFAAGGHEILTSENIKEVYGVDAAVEKYKGQLVVIPH